MTTATQVRERPILFSGQMVRAILEGRKTQTRRICKHEPGVARFDAVAAGDHRLRGPGEWDDEGRDYWVSTFCPYGKVGDRLWVRESGYERPERTNRMMREGADTWERFYYAADEGVDGEQLLEWGFKSRPSIHMPRWASRITLEITDVRVERLQAMRHDAAAFEAEGIELPPTELYPHTNRASKLERRFVELWNEINGAGSWESNPWTWVISFKRLESAQ